MKITFRSLIIFALLPLLAQAYSIATLHNFSSSDGYFPQGPSSLVEDTAGTYYGVTSSGGSSYGGVIYKMVLTGSTSSPSVSYTVVHNFGSGSDGSYPENAMVKGSSGNFYGTTNHGGAYGYGVVYKYNASSGYQVLWDFGSVTNDGLYPNGLVVDGSGNIYGTTSGGGANGYGTIFALTYSGGVWTKSTLYSFTGSTAGKYPTSLVRASDGNLYGITSQYPSGGTVFQFNFSSYSLNTIYTFSSGDYPGSNGLTEFTSSYISSGIVSLYGTTPEGGANSLGVVYSLTQASSGSTSFTYATVYDFAGGSSDGQYPIGNLLASTDFHSSFYGTTTAGGSSNTGLLYNVDLGGGLTPIHSLSGSGYDGSGPIFGTIGSTTCLMGTYAVTGSGYGLVWEVY
jgi:uncharacterized repeat protein (TIGR03803 family)